MGSKGPGLSGGGHVECSRLSQTLLKVTLLIPLKSPDISESAGRESQITEKMDHPCQVVGGEPA
jgi:hypothetical protein